MPNINAPIYQYESTFRTKEIISQDRLRFAKAWFKYFNSYDNRGGSTEELAFEAWFNMVKERYPKHTLKLKNEDHPKYIRNQLKKRNILLKIQLIL